MKSAWISRLGHPEGFVTALAVGLFGTVAAGHQRPLMTYGIGLSFEKMYVSRFVRLAGGRVWRARGDKVIHKRSDNNKFVRPLWPDPKAGKSTPFFLFIGSGRPGPAGGR